MLLLQKGVNRFKEETSSSNQTNKHKKKTRITPCELASQSVFKGAFIAFFKRNIKFCIYYSIKQHLFSDINDISR